MTRIVENFLGTVISNDGNLAECELSEDEIYMEDMQIARQDGENPEEFLRTFPVGRKLEARRVVSLMGQT